MPTDMNETTCLRKVDAEVAAIPSGRLHSGRITVDDHQRFRDSIIRPCDRFDEIDHAASDPILDRTGNRRGKREANRVLGILDSLDKEKNNRRFTT